MSAPHSLVLAVCLAVLLGASRVMAAPDATPYAITDFVRVSPPEVLTPHFDVAGGQTTARAYSAFVEIVVEGSGVNNINLPEIRTDAFYRFFASTNAPDRIEGNTLHIGSEVPIEASPQGAAFVPNCSLNLECGSLHVADLAVAYEGEAFPIGPPLANAGFAPVYNPEHRYRFIIDLGDYEGRLTLGYGDGGTFDNAGAYAIMVYQATLAEEEEVEVAFDIRPQGCRNPLNSKAGGVLPAAILGMGDLDVRDIDPAKVYLEGVAPQRFNYEDVATPFVPFVGKSDPFDCTTAGPDGFEDLTLTFDNQAVVAAEGPVARGQMLILKMTGELFDGTPIVGEDVVVVIQ